MKFFCPKIYKYNYTQLNYSILKNKKKVIIPP
jgi:hypothetical protein